MRDQLIDNLGLYDPERFINDFMVLVVVDVPDLCASYRTMDAHTALLNAWLECPSRGIDDTEGLEDGIPQSAGPGFKAAMETAFEAGLSRYIEHKLLPEFASRYPCLDVTPVISKYPVVPYSVVQAYFQRVKLLNKESTDRASGAS